MTKVGKLEARIREAVRFIVAGFENDVLDGNLNADREEIISVAYGEVMLGDNETEFKFFGKDNAKELIKQVIRESEELDSALIEKEAKEVVEKKIEEIKEEIANEKSEKEIKEETKQNSIRNARCILSILEMKNEGKKITQKYKIVYLFSHYFDPADIAEVLEVRFQVARKHIADELGMGLREFNKLPINKQGDKRRKLQDKYPVEVK